MSEKKNEIIVATEEGVVVDAPLMLRFNKPYVWEGNEYEKVDLSGLENLTAAHMIEAQKVIDRSGTFSVLPEMSVEYACIIASKCTPYPVEFFKGLPLKEAIKLKNRVTSFFYGQD